MIAEDLVMLVLVLVRISQKKNLVKISLRKNSVV